MRATFLASTLLWLGCSGQGDTGTKSLDTGEPPDKTEPTEFEVTGTVIDADGTPVEEAIVMVGGHEETMVLTDAEGAFSLWYTDTDLGQPAIVAAKQSYRAIGYEFFGPDEPISLTLREVVPPDNTEYIYKEPGDGFDDMQENCSHCHTGFVKDFWESKHSESAWNPLVQDLYAGVSQAYGDANSCTDAGGTWTQGLDPGTEDAIEKCYLGGGVLPDLNSTCGGDDQLACDDVDLPKSDAPVDFGGCADCHAPGIDGEAGGRNLHDAVGLAYDAGIHCDVCHKVREIDIDAPAGIGSRLLPGRPNEPGDGMMFAWDPVYYGPLIDVPNVVMGGSYQPQFKQAVFCAGCHESTQAALLPGESLDSALWPEGLPIQSTYSEWLAGPYNQEATPCQFCHMPGDVERTNSVDITTVADQSITFGFPREPDDIRRHIFRGPLNGEPRLIDQAVYLSIDLQSANDELEATVSVANVGCGHAMPTGEPMRALVLVVEATGNCGTLEPSGGMTIHDIGGSLAQGIEGTDVSTAGTVLSWPDGAAIAESGQVVRVVWPTGQYDDYAGVGVFGDGSFTAEEKGLEILAPVGQATVESVTGDDITLSKALDVEIGDVLYLAEAWPEEASDGQDSLHLAGLPGYTFAKVLVDSDGNRQVPHHRAVDVASDNRISSGTNTLTLHRFALPSECTEGEVEATLLYRPIPVAQADLRGWAASDSIIATAEASW